MRINTKTLIFSVSLLVMAGSASVMAAPNGGNKQGNNRATALEKNANRPVMPATPATPAKPANGTGDPATRAVPATPASPKS